MSQNQIKKCFLDTNIISAQIRNDIVDMWELEAVKKIFSFWEQGRIDCLTSEDVKDELDKIPTKYGNLRGEVKVTWRLFDKLIWNFPDYLADPLYLEIIKIFPGQIDRKHIYLAIKNNIPYFVTYDKRTILNRVLMHKKTIQKWGIEILSPKEFGNSLW